MTRHTASRASVDCCCRFCPAKVSVRVPCLIINYRLCISIATEMAAAAAAASILFLIFISPSLNSLLNVIQNDLIKQMPDWLLPFSSFHLLFSPHSLQHSSLHSVMAPRATKRRWEAILKVAYRSWFINLFINVYSRVSGVCLSLSFSLCAYSVHVFFFFSLAVIFLSSAAAVVFRWDRKHKLLMIDIGEWGKISSAECTTSLKIWQNLLVSGLVKCV